MRIGFPVIPWCSNIQPPVSSCQDQLAADMYNFFSKEGDYARYFVTVSTLCREKQTCFRGNVHSCGGSRGKKKTACVSHFIHFAIISFKCLSDWTLPSFPPLSPHIISLCGFLFLQLLEAQADYHKKSLTVLENVLPTVQAQQGNITCDQARHRCKRKKSRTKKGSMRGMTGELCVCFAKNANVVFI